MEIPLASAKSKITMGNAGVPMLIAVSKITRQGQISVPAEVRRDLGIGPGSELLWDRRENGEYVVRPKRITLADLHSLLGEPKVALSDQELVEARRDFLTSRTETLNRDDL